MDDQFEIECPYCGEVVQVYLEPDVRGSFVQDCEVCCRPWDVRVVWDGAERFLTVTRDDGADQ